MTLEEQEIVRWFNSLGVRVLSLDATASTAVVRLQRLHPQGRSAPEPSLLPEWDR